MIKDHRTCYPAYMDMDVAIAWSMADLRHDLPGAWIVGVSVSMSDLMEVCLCFV